MLYFAMTVYRLFLGDMYRLACIIFHYQIYTYVHSIGVREITICHGIPTGVGISFQNNLVAGIAVP